MLALETLLLGLIFGVHPLSLQVAPPVESVVVLLDDQEVARLNGPEWGATVDFGTRPRPRRLSIRGLDAAGMPVASVERRVNVPQPAVEAMIALRRDEAGRTRSASVVWDSFSQPIARRLDVKLDGKNLAFEDPLRIALPELDEEQPHLLTATVVIPGGETTVAAAQFGGGHADSAQVQLVSVPIERPASPEPLTIDLVRARIRSERGAIQVAALDTQPGHAFLVVDAHLARSFRARREILRREYSSAIVDDAEVVVDPTRSRKWLSLLASDDSRPRYSIVLPRPVRQLDLEDHERHVYAPAWTFDFEPSSLEAVLGLLDFSSGDPQDSQSLGNAVAAAGLLAAGTGRPRAVVLLLASSGCDTGSVSATDARAFLGDLLVPFEVWTMKPSRETCGWGPALGVARPSRLTSAMEDLRDRLARMEIAWIAGDILPQSIQLPEVW